MMQSISAMVATAILVASATPVAQSLTAQSGVTWLVFVDDLHLDFGNTGRLRDLLRRLSSELIKGGDNFAVRSTGPSMLSIDVTKDRSLLTPAIKKATGNGLRLSDIERIKT